MYAVAVTLRLHPEHTDAFMPLMLENARTSKQNEPGCLQFDICRAGDDIFLYEIYDNRAAFDAHLASPHFARFDAATADMIVSKDIRTFPEVLR